MVLVEYVPSLLRNIVCHTADFVSAAVIFGVTSLIRSSCNNTCNTIYVWLPSVTIYYYIALTSSYIAQLFVNAGKPDMRVKAKLAY